MERSRSKLDPFQALQVADRELARKLITASQDNSVDWIAPTLLGAWINFGGAEATAAYSRLRDGLVVVKGVVKNGTLGTDVFIIPVGFRPSEPRRFPLVTSTGAFGYATMQPDGHLAIIQGNNALVDLSSVVYRAEQ